MKRVLITGANSYIGVSVANWLKRLNDNYLVDTIDMIGDSWRCKDFSEYDTVFHVAGIAHVDVRKTSSQRQNLYYKVNCDLAIETAKKAKRDGVRQFIFMSSIIIYGDSTNKMINRLTDTNPSNIYGDSKLKAEKGITEISSEEFNVVIVRPPMIYGKGSKGNYPKLAKLAKTIPFFVDFKNERSMLYIDNLCEFIKLMIDNDEKGIFYPQNDQYSCTSEIVKMIANANGKHIRLTNIFNPIIRLTYNKIGIMNKIFGNYTYDFELSKYKVDYIVCDYKTSIIKTEL